MRAQYRDMANLHTSGPAAPRVPKSRDLGLRGRATVRSTCSTLATDVTLPTGGRSTRPPSRPNRNLRFGVVSQVHVLWGSSSCSLSIALPARARGAKIDAIADMLGHASTDTTRVYTKIVNRLKENPACYLEAMLE